MTNTAGPQFVLSGTRDGTSPYLQGTNGYYWPSSAYTSATRAYRLDLYGTNSTVNPASYSTKRGGSTLRCLARPQQRITIYKNLKEEVI